MTVTRAPLTPFEVERDAIGDTHLALLSACTMSQNGWAQFGRLQDVRNNVIVWVAGGEGDQRLYAYNVDTGVVIHAAGGANELMTGTHSWNIGIVAGGPIHYPRGKKIDAFTIPTETPTPIRTPLE